MEIDQYEDGVPSWVDVGSPDPAAAAAFYSALLGWESEEGPPEAGGYRVCTLRGRMVAGIAPQVRPGPSVWTTYVSDSDAEAVVARALVHLGEVLVEPMDVMEAGRMALIADPVGAVIGVWQPGQHKGAGIVNEPGAWCWSELVTSDLAKAEAFYPAVFGWQVLSHPPEEAGGMPGGYTEWQVNARSVAGMMLKPPGMPAEVPPYWGVYFMVDDADEALRRIGELGGRGLTPLMDIEQGRFAAAADPFGAMFSVLAPPG